MIMKGRTHIVGDHIDTDQIIPARYLGSLDPKVLAEGCFYNLIAQFSAKVTPGDILVGGENLGCGSSREHAPIAIKSLPAKTASNATARRINSSAASYPDASVVMAST